MPKHQCTRPQHSDKCYQLNGDGTCKETYEPCIYEYFKKAKEREEREKSKTE